jgi:hypothetical protein
MHWYRITAWATLLLWSWRMKLVIPQSVADAIVANVNWTTVISKMKGLVEEQLAQNLAYQVSAVLYTQFNDITIDNQAFTDSIAAQIRAQLNLT